MKFNSDVDIDFADRTKILEIIEHIPASMLNVKPIRKHSTGVYITNVPYDPVNNMASIDYDQAEKRGYVKLDLLNVHVYEKVKSEMHLVELMREPNWDLLKNENFVKQLVHLNNSFNLIKKMPEPINSITRMAMFLAVIRPSKKHLIGLPWHEVAKTVWDKTEDGYTFKKSHGIAYAHLVVVHMNILEEELNGIKTS